MTEIMMLKAEKIALQQRIEETEQRIREEVPPYRSAARKLTRRMIELGDRARRVGYRLDHESFPGRSNY